MALSHFEYHACRIALIKPSALGDIVHSLPVLHALRQRFPDAHITWIVSRSYESLLQGHPDLNAVLPFDRGAIRKGYRHGIKNFLALLWQIRKQRFDLVVDLQGLLRTGIMARASGAARRIGLSDAREGASWFYTDILTPPLPLGEGRGEGEIHAVDRYWLVAEALGVGQLPKSFHLPIDADDRQWADERLRHLPRPWIMMNVGTRWETKRWPAEHFAVLAQRAVHHFGGTIVLVGGPDETPLAQTVVSSLRNHTLDLTGQTTLRQLVAVNGQADVMVSNDSGPLHIAAALGRPVVAPYTCTSPVRTGPYGSTNGVVTTQVWCAASYLKRCNRMDCMKELTPDRLWPLLQQHLIQWQRRSA